MEVQLCLLAGPGTRDHAWHLVRFNIIPWTRNTIQKSKISKKFNMILGPKSGTVGSNFARERLILLDLSTKRPEKYVSRLAQFAFRGECNIALKILLATFYETPQTFLFVVVGVTVSVQIWF